MSAFAEPTYAATCEPRPQYVPRIMMSSFVDFMLATGSDRIRLAREPSPYAYDFWHPLVRALRDAHEHGRIDEAVELAVASGGEDLRRRKPYARCANAYAETMKRCDACGGAANGSVKSVTATGRRIATRAGTPTIARSATDRERTARATRAVGMGFGKKRLRLREVTMGLKLIEDGGDVLEVHDGGKRHVAMWGMGNRAGAKAHAARLNDEHANGRVVQAKCSKGQPCDRDRINVPPGEFTMREFVVLCDHHASEYPKR